MSTKNDFEAKNSTFGPKKGHFGQSGPENGPPSDQTATYRKTKGIQSYLTPLHQTLFFGFRQGNWLDSNHRLIFLAETIGSNCFIKLRCLKPAPIKISAAKLVLLFFCQF